MDVIVVKGVEYQRASLLAKKFKYTADYIGQLCRGRKVDAQLVGRSWYVNPESLKHHKKTRHIKSESTEKTFNYKVEINKSRIDVEPVLKKATAKLINNNNKNFSKRIDWKPVKYEYDEAELLPRLLNEGKKIKVDLAESSVISIKNATKETKLEPEKLPEIVLSGGIKISSLENTYEVQEFPETEDLKVEKVVKTKDEEDLIPKSSSKNAFSADAFKNQNKTLSTHDIVIPTVLPTLKPNSIKEAEMVTKITNIQKIIFSLIIAVLMITLFLVLSIDFSISITNGLIETGFIFNFDFLRFILR